MASRIRSYTLNFIRLKSFLVTNFNNQYITLKLGSKLVLFNNVFLRDSCQAPQSIDSHSRQKLFTTGAISRNLSILGVPEVIDDKLKIVWDQQGTQHISTYLYNFLEKYATKKARRDGKYFDHYRTFWNNNEISKSALDVDYHEYMTMNNSFNDVVKTMQKYGIAFINNIPFPSELGDTMKESNAQNWPVYKLAEKFGYIKRTFYGSLFDVKNVKQANNIAYTNSFLPLHMDLLYYESPPGLQLLHSLRNSTLGGENIFLDSFLAAKHIRESDPIAFMALTQIPISYQYDNNGEFYYYQRPLIVEDENVDPNSNYPFIKEVNYSPPFQGPFEFGITKGSGQGSVDDYSSHHLFQDFLRGLRMFEEFINDPKNQYKIKLKEGTCVIFDNRRVLHSRQAFSEENDGQRWLMGCYVDGDSFRSKLRMAFR